MAAATPSEGESVPIVFGATSPTKCGVFSFSQSIAEGPSPVSTESSSVPFSFTPPKAKDSGRPSVTPTSSVPPAPPSAALPIVFTAAASGNEKKSISFSFKAPSNGDASDKAAGESAPFAFSSLSNVASPRLGSSSECGSGQTEPGTEEGEERRSAGATEGDPAGPGETLTFKAGAESGGDCPELSFKAASSKLDEPTLQFGKCESVGGGTKVFAAASDSTSPSGASSKPEQFTFNFEPQVAKNKNKSSDPLIALGDQFECATLGDGSSDYHDAVAVAAASDLRKTIAENDRKDARTKARKEAENKAYAKKQMSAAQAASTVIPSATLAHLATRLAAALASRDDDADDDADGAATFAAEAKTSVEGEELRHRQALVQHVLGLVEALRPKSKRCADTYKAAVEASGLTSFNFLYGIPEDYVCKTCHMIDCIC